MSFNVLSCFDGISVGQLALQKANIKVDNYYSSEIDKWASAITRYNFPKTIELGDITKIDANKLPKINLIIGGFPCTNMSICGNRKGLKGKESSLFYEMLRLIKECKPDYFIVENVNPKKKEWTDTISKELGVNFVSINSSLVSGQSRERLYWCNFPVSQPKDKGILLKDILEEGVVDRDKSYCIDANYYKGGSYKNYKEKHRRQIVSQSTRRLIAKIGHIGNGGQGNRIYSTSGKSVTLSSQGGGRGAKTGLYLDGQDVRKLTPIECERLQTVGDKFTKYGLFYNKKKLLKKEVSNTQRYKALGNSFTCDVIVHLLQEMIKYDNQSTKFNI